MRHTETHTRELELELSWQGATVYAYVTYTVAGHWTEYYPQTRTSPEEPVEWETDREEYRVTSVVDDATGDNVPLTSELITLADTAARKHVKEYRDEYEAEWAQEASDRAEAAREAAEDARYERARDERLGC